jgi:hypothetical protein
MAEQGLASGCAAKVAGFSLHAGVMMSNAQDRSKLEMLCRYITRSGVSEKRLAITTYGKVPYQLKSALHQLQRHHPNLLKLRLLAPVAITTNICNWLRLCKNFNNPINYAMLRKM